MPREKNKYWKPKSERKSREKKIDKSGNMNTKSQVAPKKNDKFKGNDKFKKNDKRGRKVPEGACIHMYECGGCNYQGVQYESQLKKKQQEVETLLAGYTKIDKIIGMKNPYHYRNKVAAAFSRMRNGTYISGTYEEGSHRVVPIESCMIEDEKADEIIGTIRGMLKSFKIHTYDEDTGYGLLRHVLVRVGKTSGEIMVVLVLRSPILPSKKNFVKALREKHPEISTIIINVNDRFTSMILGDRENVIYGKGFIQDTLCGYTFKISPKSFYQVNPVQTEVLYQKAISYAKLTGKEKVVDAYSGIGTIGIIASKSAKEVISVELNRDAVADARWNARQNDIDNISFYEADAGHFLTQMAEQNEKVDVVFMDPPRSGSDEAFLSSVVQVSPSKVVYISCNPETLARDLEYLTEHKYKVEKLSPVDMFPWTSHCEMICVLSKR